MANSSSEAKYEVGYGKPPVANRFRKGQSGNPKGRPVGSLTFSGALTKALNKKIKVKENGVSKEISYLEAIALQQARAALQGDKGAAKLISDWVRRFESDKEMGHRSHVDQQGRITIQGWREFVAAGPRESTKRTDT